MQALVALGGNVGDVAITFAWARCELQQISASAVRTSSIWRSAPWQCAAGAPDFLNAVVLFDTLADDPRIVLAELHAIEIKAGRVRGERNAPRTLDLDLIAFGGERLVAADLVLPHPRAKERAFVLGPLAEIAAQYVLPGQRKTAQELYDALDPHARVECTRLSEFPPGFTE